MKITDLKSLLKYSQNPDSTGQSVEIELSNEIITREEIQQIAQILKNDNFNLTTLSLVNCALDHKDIEVIMDALKDRAPSLKSLNLSDNKIGHEGAKRIATSLQQKSMSNLRAITLNHTKMGDTEVEEIAKAIKVRNAHSPHSFVTIVNLTGNYIGLDAAERVVNVLGEIHVLFDKPVNNRDVHFYIDIVSDNCTYEEYQEHAAKMYQKMGVSNDNFADSSAVPFYCYQRSSSAMMFDNKYRGGEIRTSSTRSASLLTQFEKKIQYLADKFKENEKGQKLVGRLSKLYVAAKNDIDVQVSKILWEDLDKEASKLLESSAMLVLEATDQLLEKFLKEGENFDLLSSLATYHKDCQRAGDWTAWQVLVAGIIVGLTSFFAAIFPPNSFIVLAFVKEVNELSEHDPKYAFYFVEQFFHKIVGTKGTFFEPYSKLTSDVGSTIKAQKAEQSDSNDANQEKAPNKTI